MNSGSTLVSVILNRETKTIICCNTGDSRAVLFGKTKCDIKNNLPKINNNKISNSSSQEKSQWKITKLSKEHTPTDKKEKERIINSHGELRSTSTNETNESKNKENGMGPFRV
mmetsp:Transcript_27422/g.60279  ORF Transcript_27422/g.60279 Transcript_27422/m.60279 type:complete len:113 (+) Transcript_27422:500-838(+)